MKHPAEPSARHVDAAKRRLAHLAGLSATTDDSEHGILAAAGQRRAVVQADMDKLQPRVNLDKGAAAAFMQLTQERGQLDIIIAKARQALS